MFKKLMLTLFAAALTGGTLFAEEKKDSPPAQVNQVTVVQPTVSPEMIRYAVTQERRSIFEAAFKDLLTDAGVRSAFWDVYNGYETEKAGVADARMNIVVEYVNNFTTLSDPKVKELLKSSYNVQSKELKIRKKYAGLLAKKVNATVAGRFWQVDDFISSAIKISLLANVPLLGEEVK